MLTGKSYWTEIRQLMFLLFRVKQKTGYFIYAWYGVASIRFINYFLVALIPESFSFYRQSRYYPPIQRLLMIQDLKSFHHCVLFLLPIHLYVLLTLSHVYSDLLTAY